MSTSLLGAVRAFRYVSYAKKTPYIALQLDEPRNVRAEAAASSGRGLQRGGKTEEVG